MKKMMIVMIALLSLCGCSTVISDNTAAKQEENATAYNLSVTESDSSYSINGSTYITLSNEDVKISKGGTYILEGTMNDAGIIVEVGDDEDVQLVLNNVTINSGDFAGIYIIEGDEITITLAENSVNTISDSGVYTLIDENEVDALIYSKADLFINGTGKLVLNSSYNHGVVSKDDLIITEGDYVIDVAGQALKGKDCLMISDGNFDIKAGKDALKSDNDEDEYRGYINITGGNFVISSAQDAIYGLNLVSISGGNFDITTSGTDSNSAKAIKSDVLVEISGGTFNIDSSDDGIHSDIDLTISAGTFNIDSDDDALHADGKLQIDDGEFTINAHEGIEATYIIINGGNISIYATDDGLNASQSVSDYTATIEINGGYLSVSMAQGDTDGIDSNGYIIVNGGTIDFTGQNSFDAELGSEFNGGTIIINGTEVDEIPADMMGGMGGFGGMQGHGTMPGFTGQGGYPGDTTQQETDSSDDQSVSSGEYQHRPGRH